MYRNIIFCLLFVGLALGHPVQNSRQGYASFMADIFSHLVQLQGAGLNVTETACWKDSYDRGVGTPINSCPPGEEDNASLCYPLCNSGFTGVGPVCWENCQPGFTDEGALCGKGGQIISSDNSNCPWYDKCGIATAKGCSTCPSSDYHNDGCTCRIDPVVYAKKSYGRGVGTPLVCPATKEEQAALCYDMCKDSYYGVGPFCWESCPKSFPASDGALCCNSVNGCNEKVVELARSVMTAVIQALEAGEDPSQVMAAIKAAIEAALGFVLPLCTGFH